MNRDKIVDDLQGYRCWAVGWGKTATDGSGDYSNQVSSFAQAFAWVKRKLVKRKLEIVLFREWKNVIK